MSSSKSYLSLRLEGPLQSWGFDGQFNRRNTGLMPTKSAVAGMCCAALGLSRGSDEERGFLVSFGQVRMSTLAMPRNSDGKVFPVRRLEDYHTVGGGYDPDNLSERGSITSAAEDGKPRAKNGQSLAALTHRQYLTDAAFGVIIKGDAVFLGKISAALADPKWGIWLGRKTCIPSAPVLVGLRDNKDDALRLLVGQKPYEFFTRQEEAEDFTDGRDSLPDAPISFATEHRLFSLRRVRTLSGKEGA